MTNPIPTVPAEKVFIFCDRHGTRRTPVATFVQIGPTNGRGGWTEVEVRGLDAGVTLIDNEPPSRRSSDVNLADLSGHDVRSGYRLRCRKCSWTPRGGVGGDVVVREETLFQVLDKFAENGVDAVTLRLFAASLGRSPNA